MGKYGKAGKATDDNMTYAHCVLDNYGYRHALRVCNIIVFQQQQRVHGSASMLLYSYIVLYTMLCSTQKSDLALIEENKGKEKFATEWFDVKNTR